MSSYGKTNRIRIKNVDNDDQPDSITSLTRKLDNVLVHQANKRKEAYKSNTRKFVQTPKRRHEIKDVEERRWFLVNKYQGLVKRGRDSVVKLRRGIGQFQETDSSDLAALQVLIQSAFMNLERELLDTTPPFTSREIRQRKSLPKSHSPSREMATSPARPNGLSMSPPLNHAPHQPDVKRNRLLRYDANTSAARFRKACDARGVPLMGFDNRRRNLGNELLITNSLLPELDQDEDQSVPPDSVQVEKDEEIGSNVTGPVQIPTEVVSNLKKSLSTLVLPLAAALTDTPAESPRRMASGRRKLNKTSKKDLVSVVFKHRPRVLFFPVKLQRMIYKRLAPTLENSTLRIITLSTSEDVPTHGSLVRQANRLVKKEFLKVGCNVGDNRVEEGLDDGYSWDMVVLSTKEGEDVVLAVLERTFMKSYLWIHHLAVEGDYSSLGLGTWLLDRAKHLVQLRNKEGILLFALKEVLDWYGKKGFVDWGKNDWARVFSDWNGDRVMIWKPPLF